MSEEKDKSVKTELIEGAAEVGAEAAKKIPGWAWAISLIMIVIIGGFYATADKLIAYQESSNKNALVLYQQRTELEKFRADHEHCVSELAELKKRVGVLEAERTAVR